MTAFEEIDPNEAHRRMTSDPAVAYLDETYASG